MRGSRDPSLRGITNRSLPQLFARGRVHRDQPAVTRAHKNFFLPHSHARIDSRRVRAINGSHSGRANAGGAVWGGKGFVGTGGCRVVGGGAAPGKEVVAATRWGPT